MQTPAPDIKTKYNKDVVELEKLKEKAKKYRPEAPAPISFFQLLVTFSLLITLFAIGFAISFQITTPRFSQDQIKYTPQAEISLPNNGGVVEESQEETTKD